MQLYNSLNSIEEIRKALETGDRRKIIIQTHHFWSQAMDENREDAKQFLIEIAVKFPEVRSLSIGLLSDCSDSELANFFLNYIQDLESSGSAAIRALMNFGQRNVVEPDEPRIVTPLVGLLLPHEQGINEEILDALLALKAVTAIDVIAGYMEHSHPAVRVAAFRCAVIFSKIAHREDILEKAVVFLNDPAPAIRVTAAVRLKQEYPERFANLDLVKYLNDLPKS